MLYNIQESLQINLPEKHKDIITAYNTEWDFYNGQGIILSGSGEFRVGAVPTGSDPYISFQTGSLHLRTNKLE